MSSMWPCQPSGSPSSCRTQSATRSSSSVEAGDARQRSATWFSAAAISSEDRRLRRGDREVGEEARALPVRECRQEEVVEVAQDVGKGLGLLGRRGRQLRRELARPHLREHGQLADALKVVRSPVDRSMAVLAERHFFAFTFDHGPVLTT